MVYKIRVILDTKDNIFRDIEIKGKQTLWNLHLGIKSAFSLQGEELSAFNLLESDGTIIKSVPLEDMTDEGDGEIMSDVYIDEAFETDGDRAQFQYGLLDLWEFFCELVEVVEEKPAVNYPITVFRFGCVPLKAPGKSGPGRNKKPVMPLLDDEEDGFAFDEEFGGADFLDDDDDFNDDDDAVGFEDDVFDESDED
ncbi:MAG: plasmid pRiA4b ORF-3 family protein [Weeksellaceae bacterium]|nr:plasmid pRiA4b ORF-3 family protein [Weeksellaceae bacterium]